MSDFFIKITREDAHVMQSLSKAAILVMIYLRFYAGVNGEAFPSKSTLANDTGLSLGSIKRALKELRLNGVINLKSTKRTSTNIYDVGGIISEPKGDQKRSLGGSEIDHRGIISKPQGDQKRSLGGSFLSLRGIKNDPLIRSSKEIKEIDPIKESTNDMIKPDVDFRDLWLGELWAKHAVAQGWSSVDIQKDFDLIKKGATVLQVSKAVRKLDSYIVENKINGMYMGRSWALKFADRWIKKESDRAVTQWDQNKMKYSTISLDPIAVEEIKEHTLQAVESTDKAQAMALGGKGIAQDLWAQFRANTSDYEQCVDSVFTWIKNGGLNDEIHKAIKADPNLKDFAAIIDCYQI